MRKRALEAINLRRVEELLLSGAPITDEKLVEKLTGIKVNGKSQKEKTRALFEALDVDLFYQLGVDLNVVWSDRKPRLTEGFFEELREDFPFTDAFHVAYKNLRLRRTETASQLWVVKRPFENYGELLNYLKNYDPREHEPRSTGEIADEYRRVFQEYQELLGETTLYAGEFYLTLFTYLDIHIGLQMIARLSRQNPDLLDELISKYAEVARKHVEAWSKTGIEVFVSHDDVAWRGGLFFPPEWFRKHIVKWWKHIWKPVKDKDIKLIFVSDGDYRGLIQDLVETGVDGFHVEWDPSFSRREVETLLHKYGFDKIFLLHPSYEVLFRGSVSEVEEEARWFITLARKYPSIFFAGTPPANPVNEEVFLKIWFSERHLERQGSSQ
ncbi:MAG: uroporphyrinogen decarboxylase family protein [Thermoproteota archaeon]